MGRLPTSATDVSPRRAAVGREPHHTATAFLREQQSPPAWVALSQCATSGHACAVPFVDDRRCHRPTVALVRCLGSRGCVRWAVSQRARGGHSPARHRSSDRVPSTHPRTRAARPRRGHRDRYHVFWKPPHEPPSVFLDTFRGTRRCRLLVRRRGRVRRVASRSR